MSLPFFLLLASGICLALGLHMLWLSERWLLRAQSAGYQGFNRSWSLHVLAWRWPVRLLVAGEWLLLAGLLPLHTLAFTGITLLAAGALLALAQGQSAARRLKLSYHRQAWQNFRQSRRTAGALWLLKACILSMLALRTLA